MPLSAPARALVEKIDGNAATVDASALQFEVAIDDINSDQTGLLARRSMRPSLFDYQRELADAGTALFHSGNRAMLSLPTGAGKTRTAAFALLSYLCEFPRARVLWLAPTKELLWQARHTITKMWAEFGAAPDLRLTWADDLQTDDHLGSVEFRTVQSLLGDESARDFDTPDVVIFDEAHQASAPKFAIALQRLVGAADNSAVLGLSATPWRTNSGQERDLTRIFSNQLLTSQILGRDPVRFLQRRGVLSQLDFRFIHAPTHTPVPADSRLAMALKHVVTLAKTANRILVFAQSVAESEAFAHMLTTRGVPAAHLEGNVPDSTRSGILELFSRGQIRVLSNQKLLAVGYDCPAVSDLVLIPRIGSAIMFEQVVGRAARGPRTGGGRKSTIWQFDDHLALHGLPKSYYRNADYQWNV